MLLSLRSKAVCLSQSNSLLLRQIQLGVPHCSSLGLLFFLIYFNDLSIAVSCKPRLFADDTCQVKNATSPEILQNNLDLDLNKLYIWCCINKLTINPAKSVAIVISTKLRKTCDLRLGALEQQLM